MEVVGLVSAVVGLVPICINAFELMEHGFKAEQEVQQQYHSILCQQGVQIVPVETFTSLTSVRNLSVSHRRCAFDSSAHAD